MREHCRIAAVNVMSQPLDVFVKGSLSQVALMGIQIIWTHKLTEALVKRSKIKQRCSMNQRRSKFKKCFNN
jgi:hypothetical protein